MKRVMVTVRDMTEPSKPGIERSYTVSHDHDHAIVEMLTAFTERTVKAILADEEAPEAEPDEG